MTATDYIDDRGFSGQATYFADLDKCQPASALSPEPTYRRWRMLKYEAESLSGVMLLAGPEAAAPNLTYPLGVSGWHSVSVGAYGGLIYAKEISIRTKVQVLARLSGEKTFTLLTLPEEWQREEDEGELIREMYWKAADLTGQDIVLGQLSWRAAAGDGMGSLQSADARLAYIKLVPLSEAEVEAIRADQQRSDRRRLFVHNDAGSFFFRCRPTSAEDIRRHVEPYRDSDISRLYWEAGGGDLLKYPSKIGRNSTYDGLMDFPRQGDRLGAEARRLLRNRGIDPFQVALDHAHEIGIELHAAYRVAGFHYPPPLDHFNYGPSFYSYHPELRGVDKDGNPTPRLSYAYPEVRRFVISVLREIAGYDVDGICLLYNRRPPLVDYEPPLVEAFTKKYGQDPRRLDDDDPRWMSYRARVLTQFMREVREAMDSVAEEKGRGRIEVTAVVLSEQENLLNAIDLEAWINEGLVDTIVPYTSQPNLESSAESWADAGAVEYFVSLTNGTTCKLAVNLMPRDMSAEAYRRRAGALYDAGVENLFFWDADTLQSRSNNEGAWNALRRLGHREEIEAWMAAGEPSLATPGMELLRIGDWLISYDTPG